MIHKEGIYVAAFILLLALVAQNVAGSMLAIPLWLLVLLVMYLFRDPDRETPSVPLAIISPADGKITAIDEVYDDFVERPAIKISLKMYPWGIYTTRSPMEGKIVKTWRKNTSSKTDDANNTHDCGDFGIWIRSDEDDDVVLLMKPQSAWLKSIKCFVQSGERIGQGRRCGFIRFGSNLELYVPANSKISIVPGDSVQAGSSIVATLVHKTPVSAV